jgi:hypothetical protein
MHRKGIVSVLFLALMDMGGEALARSCPAAKLCRDHLVVQQKAGSKASRAACCSQKGDFKCNIGGEVDPVCAKMALQPSADAACAGPFGYFLNAVTEGCREKGFSNVFGLDGLTFGILDYTTNEIPRIFHSWYTDPQTRARFMEIFKPAEPRYGRPWFDLESGCTDTDWVCHNNEDGALACEGDFRQALQTALRDPLLVASTIDDALGQYNDRIRRSQRELGLKSIYGVVSLAVMLNNLPEKKRPECRLSTWATKCKQPDEVPRVSCMIQQYAQNGCRNSKQGAMDRAKSIDRSIPAAVRAKPYSPDTLEAITRCLGGAP